MEDQPSALKMAGQLFTAAVVLDTHQYFLHRFMHTNKYLSKIHSSHHALIVPYAYGAIYSHPLDGLLLEILGSALATLISGMNARTSMILKYVRTLHNTLLTSFSEIMQSSACVDPNYMSTQFDINETMRAILVDWLIEVHSKFELVDETLYLTINIMDRFLSKHTVVRRKLQLVGATAMILACKYEEISVPAIDDLIEISDRAYTREEVISMEKLMVNTLKFNFSVPTPYVFMRRFLKAAESDEKLQLLSYYMIELCLVEYEMLKFKPSLLAASAVFAAKCSLQGFKSWTKTYESYTTYTQDQLMECSKMVVKIHRKAGEGKLKSVHSKYNTFKFGYAAKFKPALFLLDD